MAFSKLALLALAVGARAADDQVVVGQTFMAGAIDPTPTVGMVGLIEKPEHITSQWFKDEGDAILLLGQAVESDDPLLGLGGSALLQVEHGRKEGTPPPCDLAMAKSHGGGVPSLRPCSTCNNAEPPKPSSGSSDSTAWPSRRIASPSSLNHWLVMCSGFSIKPTIPTVGVGSMAPAMNVWPTTTWSSAARAPTARASRASFENAMVLPASARSPSCELRGVGASAFSITSGRETSRFDEGRTDSCPTA